MLLGLIRSDSMKRGFTLIELIVLIVVVAVCLIVVIPVFSVREKARQARCKSNLKQMGTGMHLYTEKYGQYFPDTNGGGFLARLYQTDILQDVQIYRYLNQNRVSSNSNPWRLREQSPSNQRPGPRHEE